MSFKSKVLHIIFPFAILIFLMTGCGGEQEESVEEPAFLKELEEQEEYDLVSLEWAGFQEIEKIDPGLTVTVYFDDFGTDPGPNMRKSEGYSVTDEEYYYRIQCYFPDIDIGPGHSEYYLHSLNTSTLEAGTVRFKMEEVLGLFEDEEKKSVYLSGADALDGKICVYARIWNRDEMDNTHFLATWVDPDGTIEQVIDFMPAILLSSELETSEGWFPTSAVYDPGGYYYLIDASSRDILVTNESGEKLDLITLQDCRATSLLVTCKAPDGSPIFEYESTNGQTVIFTLDGREKKILFSGQGSYANIRKIDSFGRVVYLNNEKLLYWDASKGQCRCLYDADGINSFECTAIMGDMAEELILFFEDWGGSYLYKLKWDPDFEQKEIVLLQWGVDPYTTNCAAEYSRKHPGTVITVYEQVDTSDIPFVRIVEDIKAGNGPDVIVASRKEMLVMEAAGVLADLSDTLPQQIQDEIFSGVLQYGIIDDKLYGIPYEAHIDTLLVSDEIWSEDTWTVQDIMELMKQNPDFKRCIGISYGMTADHILYALCLRNLEGSPFVDLQEKTCSFDTEEFYSLLRFCKEYEEAPGDQESRALAYGLEGGLVKFSQVRAGFSEDFHCVGYPTNGANGSVVTCYRCVAVSELAENREIVDDFLKYLLSEECQVAYTTNWVRRDVMTDHVQEHTGRSEGPVFKINDHSIVPLEGRADGSSYLDEYLILMEEGAVLSTEYEIQNIVLEEAASYFSGDKSEQEAANVIQRRVQNYLDEKK